MREGGCHLLSTMSVQKISWLPARREGLSFAGPKNIQYAESSLASSAAIGGPATAAALAKANGWSSLVTPSLLVGNLGYAVATFAAIVFYRLMLG